MKQQVSLPGFAVPAHTPATPARDETAAGAAPVAGLSHGPADAAIADSKDNAPDSSLVEAPADLADSPVDGSPDIPADDNPENLSKHPAKHPADPIPASENSCAFAERAEPQNGCAATGQPPVIDAAAVEAAPCAAPDVPDDTEDAAPSASSGTSGSSASAAPVAPAAEEAPAVPAEPALAAAVSPAASGASEQDDWPPMSEMLQSFFVFEPTTAAPEPITVMGLDCARPRGLAGLAEAQRRLAEKADVICAGRLLLEEFSGSSLDSTGSIGSTATAAAGGQAAEGQTEIDSTTVPAAGPVLKARLLPLTTPLEPLLTRLSQLRAAGERVLVLADGDPLLFGIGATLVRRMGPDAVRLLPAVSSLQQACARLSLPWHKVICLSLHGRDDLRPLNVACGKNAPLCILTDARMSPDVLARHLLDRGVDWFDAHIFESMGAADECVSHLSLADAAGREFGPACTMVLIPMAPARRPHLGLDADQLAVDRGLISKKPVRAAALALLRIEAGHVVWDLGSGSGAVALEASVLAHEGRVIAVERSAGRAMGIQENRRRFGAANVEVRLGQAPECLPGLPDPQRVFIGGGLSGDDGDDILGHVCLRLPVGGRVVASCVLLDSFSLCRRFFEDMGWPVEILQISAAEGKSLGGDVHLAAMNPVFLLAAQKPAPAPIQSGAQQPEGR